MNFDLTSWSGVVAVVVAVVGAVKKAFPTWTSGKEEFLATAGGLLTGLAVRASGAMTFDPGAGGWTQAAIGGLLAGLAAQVVHDKMLNPLTRKKAE